MKPKGVVQPSCDHRVNKLCAPVVHVTWATEFGYQWDDYIDQYVASVYYTFATLLTVGYGDIHSVNGIFLHPLSTAYPSAVTHSL